MVKLILGSHLYRHQKKQRLIFRRTLHHLVVSKIINGHSSETDEPKPCSGNDWQICLIQLSIKFEKDLKHTYVTCDSLSR